MNSDRIEQSDYRVISCMAGAARLLLDALSEHEGAKVLWADHAHAVVDFLEREGRIGEAYYLGDFMILPEAFDRPDLVIKACNFLTSGGSAILKAQTALRHDGVEHVLGPRVSQRVFEGLPALHPATRRVEHGLHKFAYTRFSLAC